MNAPATYKDTMINRLAQVVRFLDLAHIRLTESEYPAMNDTAYVAIANRDMEELRTPATTPLGILDQGFLAQRILRDAIQHLRNGGYTKHGAPGVGWGDLILAEDWLRSDLRHYAAAAIAGMNTE